MSSGAEHSHHHGHSHDHGHGHGHAQAGADGSERKVMVMLALQVTYMLVEVAGGLWTGSLALLADAGHMALDAFALLLALIAIRMAKRPADPQRTYGHHRAEILAATANGSLLIALSGGVAWEAVQRMSAPTAVEGGPMLWIAAGGLAANLAGLALFAGAHGDNLNLRAAWLHVLSDALGSIGAMAAAGAVMAFGWTWADPAVSLLIAALVLRGAWRLLHEAVGILMESAPPHIDVAAVREAMRGTSGVIDVHDLHVWTIASGRVAMSGHVVSAHECPSAPLLGGLRATLLERFGITHVTIQVEPPGFVEDDLHP